MKVHKFQKKDVGKDYQYSLSVCLNDHDNGGEAVTLKIDVYDNGDDENSIYYNTFLKTQCYGTSSTEIALWSVSLENIKEGIDTLINQINDETLRRHGVALEK